MEIEGMTGLIIDSYRRENFRQGHGEQRYRAKSISQDRDRSIQQFRDISRGRDQSRDTRQQSRNVLRDRGDRPESESRSRSGCHVSTNRDRL